MTEPTFEKTVLMLVEILGIKAPAPDCPSRSETESLQQ
jgi:hypothetical protein